MNVLMVGDVAGPEAVDGRAATVLGTYEPTLTLHVLPGGTALVADVGLLHIERVSQP